LSKTIIKDRWTKGLYYASDISNKDYYYYNASKTSKSEVNEYTLDEYSETKVNKQGLDESDTDVKIKGLSL
jgi:hypothetical protein